MVIPVVFGPERVLLEVELVERVAAGIAELDSGELSTGNGLPESAPGGPRPRSAVLSLSTNPFARSPGPPPPFSPGTPAASGDSALPVTPPAVLSVEESYPNTPPPASSSDSSYTPIGPAHWRTVRSSERL